ncbi:MAG: penicillin-binding transpeptidase domain-containing protein [Solirubrobacteraceae bacterium]
MLPSSRQSPRRRRRPRLGGAPRRVPWPRIGGLVLVAAILAGGYAWLLRQQATDDRHAAAVRFAKAWQGGDRAAMWRALTPAARAKTPQAAFAKSYDAVDETAGVTSVRTGRAGEEQDGTIALPVAVELRDFDALRGTIALPVSGSGEEAGVGWQPSLRLPGLRAGESVRVRAGRQPRRAQVLAADGSRLDSTPAGASVVGEPGEKPTGLQRVYDERLAGHPSASLLFGRRVVDRTSAQRGRSLKSTLRPGLMRAAQEALGERTGGVAVIRPRDGALLAVAGLAVSAPQPPGSTFKIITTAAALESGVAKPSTTFPLATFATLSGVKLGNAGGERCGGTLTEAFVESCNSVFAPLGAKVGAKRLVKTARAFGFGEQSAIPASKPSTIASADELRDALAVGSAAIGQERDLATPLQMASVAATIATGGQRVRPRIATIDKVVKRRVVSARTARQIRSMMVGVVRSGTGKAAALPGVQVAGKTGTAELRPNSDDPKDADAWFVAFAPAQKPKVAVAVLLVGAGFGGTTAAPVAKKVLAAALG